MIREGRQRSAERITRDCQFVLVLCPGQLTHRLDVFGTGHDHHEDGPRQLAGRNPDRWAHIFELHQLGWDGSDDDSDIEKSDEVVALVAIEFELAESVADGEIPIVALTSSFIPLNK